jgi:hypothetical protein
MGLSNTNFPFIYYTPLWKRGGRGDFPSIILKSPFIPLCQSGIKTPVTEALLPAPFFD